MLSTLRVENYALIDTLDVNFDSRLNIITGETGAGKSILLGALSLLLGAKGDAAAIKDTSRNCIVEGEFLISPNEGIKRLFDEHDIEYDDECIVRRVITPSGKSRAFVNDSPVPLATLKELGQYLIDIHSQHQNLILSSGEFRIEALDTIAGCTAVKDEYRSAYAELCRLRRELADARTATARSREDEQWLRHQVEELTAAALREGEDAELETELQILENADRIREALGALQQALGEEQTGVLSILKESENALKHITGHYPAAATLAERIRSVAIELKDVEATVTEDSERIDSDPERLDKVSNRLNLIYTLCAKHRVETLAELVAKRDGFATQLHAIVHGDERIAELEQAVATSEKLATTLAAALHEAREAIRSPFAGEVASILSEVGMPDARFEIALSPAGLSADGADEIEFLFTANPGVEPRRIEKIASGGELSRVMLALKSILARKLSLPTIIFDEIDTGVSGRVANAVGEIISRLSGSMQVIDITHLPQVASKGSMHFLVYKSNGTTDIRPLTAEERVEEIAKMLSGDKITDAAIAQARILLGR